MPEIDLKPDEFRAVLDRPLMKRRTLLCGLVFFGGMLFVSGCFAFSSGGIYVLSVAILGICFGAFWVGLAPGFWFRTPPTSYSLPADMTPRAGEPIFNKGPLIGLIVGIAVFFALLWAREYFTG